MLATFITAFVFGGVMSAYIFLGRGLARQVNEQGLESRARLTLYTLQQDVTSASSIEAADPGTQTTGDIMSLAIPAGTAVYHADWSGGTSSGILERQLNGGSYVVLATNLTSLSVQFYDSTTNAVSVSTTLPSSPQANIKQVGLSYTSVEGYAPSGNVSHFTVVSPLIPLGNKGTLTDSSEPQP